MSQDTLFFFVEGGERWRFSCAGINERKKFLSAVFILASIVFCYRKTR